MWLTFPSISFYQPSLCSSPISVPRLLRSPFCFAFIPHLSPLIYCLPPPTPNVVILLDPLDIFSFSIFHCLYFCFSVSFVLTLFAHTDFSSFPDSLHLFFSPYLSLFVSCCCLRPIRLQLYWTAYPRLNFMLHTKP